MRSSITPKLIGSNRQRRGNILALSAGVLVMVMAFVAFTVDVGYISLARTQMQATTDGSTLAAGIELIDGLGYQPQKTPSEVETAARDAATAVAAENRVGEQTSAYLDGADDVRFGRYFWDSATGTWVKSWGTSPYNMVEATVRREQGATVDAGGSLPLFFAPVIGHDTADLRTRATAALLPAVGFRVTSGSSLSASVLPITLDEPTWHDLRDGLITTDNYTYDPDTGDVSSGPDGIPEVNLYPQGSSDLPPGNRGTVDFGGDDNSTSDLSRQILYGLNDEDLSYFNGELRFDQGSIDINGDTGISAGIKDELQTIRGIPRAIPIFTDVQSPGDNAVYTINTLVGIRVMNVKLTGSASTKRVIVQPAAFVAPTAIRQEGGTSSGSQVSYYVYAPLTIIE